MLTARDDKGAIREMVSLLVNDGHIKADSRERVIHNILARHAQCSTSIGEGVAIPHTQHCSVSRVVGAVGVCSDGIDFNSVDGQPVRLVFLLVAPSDRPREHLQALDKLSRELRDETFRRSIAESTSSEHILSILEEADNNCVT